MKPLFKNVSALDEQCRARFGISEELMMEHAAVALKQSLQMRLKSGSVVLVVCGSGNNGADGLALARILYEHEVYVFLPFGAKSELCKLQLDRANRCGVSFIDLFAVEFEPDAVVDCLFGSGLQGALNDFAVKIIEKMNRLSGFKLACDLPSGIDSDGLVESIAFLANETVTMGAANLALYSDFAKDYTGEILTANLGVSERAYASLQAADAELLELLDIKLPHRKKQNVHKGSFGHVAVVAGDKPGAAIIAALAAQGFGAGLTTIVAKSKVDAPCEIMQSGVIPANTTAICIGSGLGDAFSESEIASLLDSNISAVIDADMFSKPEIKELIGKKSNLVLTPHPKEFASLLSLLDITHCSAEEVQKNRFAYASQFGARYPKTTLLLKGANTVLAYARKLYVMPFGSAAMSKGGSGDALAGMIAALLAQGYSPFDAAVTASMAHALAAKRFKGNSYALTPLQLIEELKCL